MIKQQIVWMKGLPGSGKSTWAKEWVSKDATHRVRVNKDDLRLLLHEGKFSKGNENQILRIQLNIILDTLKEGKSIVIDNTHLIEKHLENLKNILLENNFKNIPLLIQDFTDVSPEECIKRDLIRANSVGSNIIWRMYWDHIAVINTVLKDNSKPKAIIVDIDGTLAEMYNRGPFEWEKVGQDLVKTYVKTLVSMKAKAGYEVLIVSGRDISCKELTIDWLEKNNIGFSNVFLRGLNDYRKDYIIKQELYNNFIEPFYNVELVLDDRPQVIREWRRLGLNVINVNPCDREF